VTVDDDAWTMALAVVRADGDAVMIGGERLLGLPAMWVPRLQAAVACRLAPLLAPLLAAYVASVERTWEEEARTLREDLARKCRDEAEATIVMRAAVTDAKELREAMIRAERDRLAEDARALRAELETERAAHKRTQGHLDDFQGSAATQALRALAAEQRIEALRKSLQVVVNVSTGACAQAEYTAKVALSADDQRAKDC
jgi:hypothetical protein